MPIARHIRADRLLNRNGGVREAGYAPTDARLVADTRSCNPIWGQPVARRVEAWVVHSTACATA